MTPEDRMKIETATAWRPIPGDEITGYVITTRRRETEYGVHPVVILDLRTDETYTAVHAFHTVLKTRLAEIKPKPGDRLTIHYVGKIDGKGNPYHSYVAFNPDDTTTTDEFNWDTEDDGAAF